MATAASTLGQTTGTGTDPAVSTEVKVKAEEKAKSEQAAAVSGAQAVADAVSKVANAAVDAAKSAQAFDAGLDFVITGHPGGTFEARGKGFSSSGAIFVNGRRQETFEWGDTYIRGRLDADVTSGEVTVPIDDKKKLVGYLKV